MINNDSSKQMQPEVLQRCASRVFMYGKTPGSRTSKQCHRLQHVLKQHRQTWYTVPHTPSTPQNMLDTDRLCYDSTGSVYKSHREHHARKSTQTTSSPAPRFLTFHTTASLGIRLARQNSADERYFLVPNYNMLFVNSPRPLASAGWLVYRDAFHILQPLPALGVGVRGVRVYKSQHPSVVWPVYSGNRTRMTTSDRRPCIRRRCFSLYAAWPSVLGCLVITSAPSTTTVHGFVGVSPSPLSTSGSHSLSRSTCSFSAAGPRACHGFEGARNAST